MKKGNRAARFLKFLYLKLCRINDTPQKIAQGLGLGVALGVMPGVGILAAIMLAFLFRMNRASAILGALITNTWTSVLALILSIKTGAWITQKDWHTIYAAFSAVLRHFSLKNLLALSFTDILLPTALGYLIVSACLGLLTYVTALFVVTHLHALRKKH